MHLRLQVRRSGFTSSPDAGTVMASAAYAASDATAVSTVPAPLPQEPTDLPARVLASNALDRTRTPAIVTAADRVAPAVVSVNVTRRERRVSRSMFDWFFVPRGYEREVQGLGSGLMRPAVAAGGSLAVEPEEQGAVAGFNSSTAAVGFVFVPVVLMPLYLYSPTAPFWVAFVLSALMLLTTRSKQLDVMEAPIDGGEIEEKGNTEERILHRLIEELWNCSKR